MKLSARVGRMGAAAVLAAISLLSAVTVHAAADDITDPVDHRRHLELLGQASRVEFDRVIAWYDDYLQSRSFDVAAAVQRCRFMGGFAADFEYVDWVDEVYEKQSDCGASLGERYGSHPEVELYEFEQLYGEEAIKQGKELLRRLDDRWTQGQSSRLYTKLAANHQSSNPVEAKRFALLALQTDAAADVRLIAARQLVAEGNRSQALEILASPADGHDPTEYWYASEKMQLLTQIGAYAEARSIYEAVKAAGTNYDRIAASKLLRQMHAFDAARAELQPSAANQWNTAAFARELYFLEFDHGTPLQALSAYNTLRDSGYLADPLGVNRAALLAKDVGLPWRLRDFLGLFSGMGVLAMLSLLVIVPVSLVHYRGLARRARTGEPPPAGPGWHLRHACMVLVAYAAASFLVLYFIGPVQLSEGSGSWWDLVLAPEQWARAAIWGEVAMLLLAAVIALAAGRPEMPWTGRWTMVKAISVGVGIGIVLRVPLLLAMFANAQIVEARLLKGTMIEIVGFIRDHYGVLSAGWLLCVAAPVLEEFIFRGVLLQSFARHVSFAWANLFQAALFAAVHMNLAGTPVFFIYAVIAGIVTRRSGGLLAAMVAHASFNLVVAFIVLK